MLAIFHVDFHYKYLKHINYYNKLVVTHRGKNSNYNCFFAFQQNSKSINKVNMEVKKRIKN